MAQLPALPPDTCIVCRGPSAGGFCARCHAQMQYAMQQALIKGSQQLSQLGGQASGQHRQTNQATSGGSAGSAYTSPGGASQAGGYGAFPTQQIAYAQFRASQIAMAHTGSYTVAALGHRGDPYAGIEIEECGIRAGEIYAWRCWMIDTFNMLLRSMAVNAIWVPGETMGLGRAGEQVAGGGDKLCHFYGNGVHAFKTLKWAHDNYYPNPHYVFGVVALWGEVIEHQGGYRAEFGKIVSLDEVGYMHEEERNILEALRTRYRVEGKSHKDFGLES